MYVLYLHLRLKQQSGDVQYTRFDCEGNIYLYEPGAGKSGEARRVIQYRSDEIIYADKLIVEQTQPKKENYNKFSTVRPVDVHHILPKKGGVVTNSADSKTRWGLVSDVVYFNQFYVNFNICEVIFYRSSCKYNDPLDVEAMDKLACMSFSKDTLKKFCGFVVCI